MRSTGGVKMNWPLVAIAFAVIGVPISVAVIQDLGTDRNEEEILAKLGQLDEISSAEEDEAVEEDEAELEDAEEIAGKWSTPAMDQAFFDEVFLGGPEETRPALRGPLAGIRWDVEPSLPPDLARWPRAHVELRSGKGSRIDAVVVSFPDDGSAERIFTSRWGEPLVVLGSDHQRRRIWLDPDARLRLVLEEEEGQARASIVPYTPVRDLITPAGRFEFESFPVLGASAELLAAKYGSAFSLDPSGSMGFLSCPGIEASGIGPGVWCVVVLENSKVVALIVNVSYALDADIGPQIFSTLRSRLGAVRTQTSDDLMNTWTFDRGVTVTQEVGSHVLSIERRAR
jgi:hypothetical protein